MSEQPAEQTGVVLNHMDGVQARPACSNLLLKRCGLLPLVLVNQESFGSRPSQQPQQPADLAQVVPGIKCGRRQADSNTDEVHCQRARFKTGGGTQSTYMEAYDRSRTRSSQDDKHIKTSHDWAFTSIALTDRRGKADPWSCRVRGSWYCLAFQIPPGSIASCPKLCGGSPELPQVRSWGKHACTGAWRAAWLGWQ